MVGVEEDADIGGIGESTLMTLAHEAKITPNRVECDRNGWDFFLEFPRENINSELNTPLDLAPPEISCLFQVKATRNLDSPINVSLSNWARLIKVPVPAFFSVFEIGGDNKPQRAFVVHVNAEWSEKVLARLRRMPVDRQKYLHEQTLRLKWRAEDELSAIRGQELAKAIRAAVGADLFKYVTQKEGWFRNAGYDQRPYRVSITLPEMKKEDCYNAMANFAIGQIERLPIISLYAGEVRFGTEVPLRHLKDPTEAYLHVSTRPSVGEQTVEVITNSEMVALRCKVYSSAAMFPFLPPEYHKMAFVSDVASFVLASKGDRRISVGWESHIPHIGSPKPLSDAAAAAKVFRLLTDSANRPRLRFELGDKGYEFPAENARGEFTMEMGEYANVIENAGSVASFFGIHGDTVVDSGSLLAQTDNLQMLAAFLRPHLKTEMSARLGFSSLPADVLALGKMAMLLNLWARIGEQIAVIVGAIVGKPVFETLSERTYITVQTMQPRIMARRLLRSDNVKDFCIQALFLEAEQTLLGEGVERVMYHLDEDSETLAELPTETEKT